MIDPRRRHVNLGAAAAGVEAALGEGHGEPPFGAIVRRAQQALGDGGDEELLQSAFGSQIQVRRLSRDHAVQGVQILAPAELAVVFAEQDDGSPRLPAPGSGLPGFRGSGEGSRPA